MHKIIEFCSKCSSCPVVEINDDSVKIGEKDNMVTLTSDQFADLKQAITDGRI